MALNITKLLISVAVCLAAGFIGSFFTSSSIPTWYAALNKPFFNPPNWLFAPVWTLLYILMGVALYLVWNTDLKTSAIKTAIIIFVVQLILNVLWSLLFFGMKAPLYAFIEIIILWLAIAFTMIKFYPISPTAAYLLLPYILWVSFASILNFFIWRLNP